jgi:hypothetical protein
MVAAQAEIMANEKTNAGAQQAHGDSGKQVPNTEHGTVTPANPSHTPTPPQTQPSDATSAPKRNEKEGPR